MSEEKRKRQKGFPCYMGNLNEIFLPLENEKALSVKKYFVVVVNACACYGRGVYEEWNSVKWIVVRGSTQGDG